MNKSTEHSVVEIEHLNGDIVYCWTRPQGVETVKSCLQMHPKEEITVRTILMTEAEFDALPEYDGDC